MVCAVLEVEVVQAGYGVCEFSQNEKIGLEEVEEIIGYCMD